MPSVSTVGCRFGRPTKSPPIWPDRSQSPPTVRLPRSPPIAHPLAAGRLTGRRRRGPCNHPPPPRLTSSLQTASRRTCSIRKPGGKFSGAACTGSQTPLPHKINRWSKKIKEIYITRERTRCKLGSMEPDGGAARSIQLGAE